MRTKPSHLGFTPQEHRISALPSTIASVVVLIFTVINSNILPPTTHFKSQVLLWVGVLGVLYLIVYNFLVIPSADFTVLYTWFNAFAISLGLGLLTYAVPQQLDIYVGVLLILAVISSSITSERGPSYAIILISTL